MISRLNYLWRLSVTGACFAAFGVGGIVLTMAVFPAMRLLPGGTQARVRRVRWMIHKFFAALIWLVQCLGLMRLKTDRIDILRNAGSVLVLANHPTYIDVVVLIAHMPMADCVVKNRLWRSPFFGGIVRAADYIRNDDNPDTFIKNCAHRLAGGSSLIVFPEGTRTVPDQPLRFLRGAAHIALKSRVSILPVLIHCAPPTLTKGEKWYGIPTRSFQLSVHVRPLLQVSELVRREEENHSIAARRLTEWLERYFSEELDADARSAA